MSTDLGERFARALAGKDAVALKKLLSPTVTFRALTPGRALGCDDAATVVDEVILGTWFTPDRSITRILAIDCDEIGSVQHVGYRFATTWPDGDFVIEQQAYFTSEADTITSLRILCSGFVHGE